MPTCRINVDTIDEGAGTATYSDGGGPGQVQANGDIEFNAAIPNLDLEFTLTAAGYEFRDSGFTAVEVSPFGTPIINPSTVCTAPDDNTNAIYEYTLYLSNAAGDPVDIHPRIINR